MAFKGLFLKPQTNVQFDDASILSFCVIYLGKYRQLIARLSNVGGSLCQQHTKISVIHYHIATSVHQGNTNKANIFSPEK